MFYKCI